MLHSRVGSCKRGRKQYNVCAGFIQDVVVGRNISKEILSLWECEYSYIEYNYGCIFELLFHFLCDVIIKLIRQLMINVY